jgi:hypothetical protein
MKGEKTFSFLVNLSIVSPIFFALLIISSPVASAQSSGSCNVPAVNDLVASNSISLEPVGDSFWNNEGPLYSLQSDVFVDFTVDNDSATAVSMKLVPGYMYSFCISITSNQDDPPLNPSSDIYLMTQPNWDRYTLGYELHRYCSGTIIVNSEVYKNIRLQAVQWPFVIPERVSNWLQRNTIGCN